MNISEILAGATDLQASSSSGSDQQRSDWMEADDILFDMANYDNIENWYDVLLHGEIDFEDAGAR